MSPRPTNATGNCRRAPKMAVRIPTYFGDATLAKFRGRGIQQALIAHRARLTRDAGCDLAVACVVPGSGSHRNYERSGFRLVYMRVNVMRSI